MASISVIVLRLILLLRAINKNKTKKKGVIILLFERFSSTCSSSAIRLVLALTAVPGWYLLDLDVVCALIPSDLAPGESAYVKGPAAYW